MTSGGWTAVAVVTVSVAWLGLVWSQGFQKYQDHASQLFKDFEDSGAIDAALARVDSQQVDPAIIAVINVATELTSSSSPADLRDILSRDDLAPARGQLADSMRAREDILQRYRRLESMARWSREAALYHVPVFVLGICCYFFLDASWQTIGMTVFAVLAVATVVAHWLCALFFGRQREEFQRCLKPRRRDDVAR